MVPRLANLRSVLAAVIVLVLLGGGALVYAVPVQPVDTTDSPQTISFVLAPAASSTQAPTYPNATGRALIEVHGPTLGIEWVANHLAPGLPVELAMVVNSSDLSGTRALSTVVANGDGTAESAASVTLGPGDYSIGLRVFESGNGTAATDLILTSFPSFASLSLSGTTSAQHYTDTEEHTGATGSYGFTLVPLPTYLHQDVPDNYSFKEGGAVINVYGTLIAAAVSFVGDPNTQYSLVLSRADANMTLGTVTTDGSGEAVFRTTHTVAPGVYTLGFLVFAGGDHGPLLALSVPRSVTVAISANPAGSTTTAESESHSSTSPFGSIGSGGEHNGIRLVPAPLPGAPTDYKFGGGTAVFYVQHGYLVLVAGIMGANPSTTYVVVLSLNGTHSRIGTMTTNGDGSSYFKNAVQVDPGNYALGVLLYDSTSFNNSAPVLALESDPGARFVIVVPAASIASASSGAEHSTASQASQNAVRTVNGGGDVEGEIRQGLENLTIPAVVQISALSSSTKVFDPRFSVSVGTQTSTGLVIAISGSNITGPRVLMLNLSKTSPLTLFPALNVTLDGLPVAEASSATQVLNPSPGDPARYVLVSTSTGVQLLVSIPHFSVHIIQISGAAVQTLQSILELDAPLLAGSILAITIAFGALYAARRRIYSLFI